MIDTSKRPAKVTRSHQEVYSQELGLQSITNTSTWLPVSCKRYR